MPPVRATRRMPQTFPFLVMKTKPITKAQQLARYRAMRRKRAQTLGSEWVYFRDGDKEMKDPWSGLEIRIVKVEFDRRGRVRYFAECTQKRLLIGNHPWVAAPVHRDRFLKPRRVFYSELW